MSGGWLLGVVSLVSLAVGFEPHQLSSPYGPAYWTLFGNASVHDDRVRLTQHRASQSGRLYNVFPNSYVAWEAEATLEITGDADVGADGVALWYTTRRDEGGLLYGNAEKFVGIGAIVDTYDNDGTGVHPYVMLVFNDGTKQFTAAAAHHIDGQRNPLELGGCPLAVRNTGVARLRLRYNADQTLVLSVRAGGDAHERECARAKLDVPVGGYFGFSAATGGLSDNHDVLGFSLRNLAPDDSDLDHADLPSELVADAMFETARQITDIHRRIGNCFGGSAAQSQQLHQQPLLDLTAIERSVGSMSESVRSDIRLLQVHIGQMQQQLQTLQQLQQAAPPQQQHQQPAAAADNTWLQIATFYGVVALLLLKVYDMVNDAQRRRQKMF
jgi:mannose-binding lectin 1